MLVSSNRTLSDTPPQPRARKWRARRRPIVAVSARAMKLLAPPLVATLGACSDATAPKPTESVDVSGAARAIPSIAVTSKGSSSKSKRWSFVRQVSAAAAQSDPAFANATATTFPTTQVVINTCRKNEAVVLNGTIRQWESLQFNSGMQSYQLLTWTDTRGVYGAATELQDTDANSATAPVPVSVNYVNRQLYLDRFDVGESGLPFTSVQISAMYLHRQSASRNGRRQRGDDLIVYAAESMKVDINGVSTQGSVYKTFCW